MEVIFETYFIIYTRQIVKRKAIKIILLIENKLEDVRIWQCRNCLAHVMYMQMLYVWDITSTCKKFLRTYLVEQFHLSPWSNSLLTLGMLPSGIPESSFDLQSLLLIDFAPISLAELRMKCLMRKSCSQQIDKSQNRTYNAQLASPFCWRLEALRWMQYTNS